VAVTERASWFYIFLGPIEDTCGGIVNVAHPDYEPKEFKTSVFDGAPIDGVCTGKSDQQNIQLKKAVSTSGVRMTYGPAQKARGTAFFSAYR